MTAATVVLLSVLALAPQDPVGPPAPVAPLAPGRHSRTLEVGGWTRRFLVQVPPAADPGGPLPLVLVFHGAGGSGAGALDHDGWAALADRERCIVVAPDGLPAVPRRPANFLENPRVWNSGQLRPLSPRARIDDVAFVRAILDDLAGCLNIDPDRVYAAGHSNGAGLTFRLGAELSDRLAAIAPVASHCWQPDPRPAHPRPTLFLIGTADPVAPLAGGRVALPWDAAAERPPLSQTFERWTRALGCDPAPKVERDDAKVRIEHYAAGASGADLTVYFLKGQGHGWPGGTAPGVLARWIGPSVETVDATRAIWEFFRDHPRAGAPAPAAGQGPAASSTP